MKDYPVHIKLDTGMHRLGFVQSEINNLTDYLKTTPEVRVKSMFSHLCVAEDPEQDAFTLSQIELFKSLTGQVADAIGYMPMRHILNSAGIERFPQYQFDMVRLGIGIYGVSAIPGRRLAPVASLKCKILQIKHLQPGDTVGYGRWGHAGEGTVIATIPVGYADGIDRHLGRGAASFSVNGHRAPTIGNICMDMCMLDVTGIPAEVGDTVTIFGEDPEVTELADILGTIPYEILASVPRRIERIVIR
jgi:alanine racemase